MDTTEPTTTNTVVLYASPHTGYSARQVESRLTLRELAEVIADAIAAYGPDAQVVTYDRSNHYGAQWGSVARRDGLIESLDEHLADYDCN